MLDSSIVEFNASFNASFNVEFNASFNVEFNASFNVEFNASFNVGLLNVRFHARMGNWGDIIR